jgi:hypothetical protein
MLSNVMSFNFCGQRGVKAYVIHRRMLAQYEENWLPSHYICQIQFQTLILKTKAYVEDNIKRDFK